MSASSPAAGTLIRRCAATFIRGGEGFEREGKGKRARMRRRSPTRRRRPDRRSPDRGHDLETYGHLRGEVGRPRHNRAGEGNSPVAAGFFTSRKYFPIHREFPLVSSYGL